MKLSRQDVGCAAEVFEQLPPTLRALSLRSLRIQERVIHLDRASPRRARPRRVPAQRGRGAVERLKMAFSD